MTISKREYQKLLANNPELGVIRDDGPAPAYRLTPAPHVAPTEHDEQCAYGAANPLTTKFEALWQRWGGPPLTREYKFSATRRWRLDYYCEGNGARIGIEIHGGVWTQGRHVRGKGFMSDLEKLNAAQMQGIIVLQLGTDQIDAAHVGELADFARRKVGCNSKPTGRTDRPARQPHNRRARFRRHAHPRQLHGRLALGPDARSRPAHRPARSRPVGRRRGRTVHRLVEDARGAALALRMDGGATGNCRQQLGRGDCQGGSSHECTYVVRYVRFLFKKGRI